MILADNVVLLASAESIPLIVKLIPNPTEIAINEAIIPTSGFLLPCLNNDAAIGINTTYVISPEILNIIHSNYNQNQ